MTKNVVIGAGQKSVLTAEPYCVPKGDPLIGREPELRLLTAAWMVGGDQQPLSPLLLGDPGTGKGKIVFEMARRTNKPLFVLAGHDDLTAEDVGGCVVRFSDHPERKFDYLLGPVMTAALVGGICFLDEIGKIRPRALAPLAALLDERRYLDSTLLSERIHAHPGFRFVAATNSSDLDALSLPEFLRTRLRPVIPVGPPSREAIDKIITSRFVTRFGCDDGDALLEAFWNGWTRNSADVGPTPRDAIQVWALATKLADYGSLATRPDVVPFEVSGGAVVQPCHLNEAINAFFTAGTRS